MDLSFATISSPVGTWVIEGTSVGVTRVHMPHEGAITSSSHPHEPVARAREQLEEYFHGTRRDFDVEFAQTAATSFQHAVWRALVALPYGSVATYARVAEMAGHPGAARAVGNANHANPWPVLVPCHRVVASSGLGGYGGGEDVKRYLLTLEGVRLESVGDPKAWRKKDASAPE